MSEAETATQQSVPGARRPAVSVAKAAGWVALGVVGTGLMLVLLAAAALVLLVVLVFACSPSYGGPENTFRHDSRSTPAASLEALPVTGVAPAGAVTLGCSGTDERGKPYRPATYTCSHQVASSPHSIRESVASAVESEGWQAVGSSGCAWQKDYHLMVLRFEGAADPLSRDDFAVWTFHTVLTEWDTREELAANVPVRGSCASGGR
jgi:hypothetical protein